MQHKPLSILIVEDEPGDQALVVTYLRHKSFRHAAGAPNLVWAKSLHGREGEFRHPDGHPNSPTYGHLKFPHPCHAVRVA
jgi:hypothetical protein